jgi:hypothetical protein
MTAQTVVLSVEISLNDRVIVGFKAAASSHFVKIVVKSANRLLDE